MAGKQDIQSETIEQILEAVCFYENFIEELDAVLKDLLQNEDIDHENDKLRHQALGLLHDAERSNSLHNHEETSANLYSAVSKIHEADALDFKDDLPRAEARLKLSILREKAYNNRKILDGILTVIGRKRRGSDPAAK